MAWEAKLKLIIVLENLGLGDSVGPFWFHLFYDPENLRAQCFPFYQFFSFCKFMYCLCFLYCLALF